MGDKKEQGFYRAVLESKEFGVLGQFWESSGEGWLLSPRTSGLPGECDSLLQLPFFNLQPSTFNLLDGALARRLTLAGCWESEMIQA